jgi:hypothetical protein
MSDGYLRRRMSLSETRSLDRGERAVRSGLSGIISVVYLVVGLVVASSHAYLTNLTALLPILSAILAVVLWPLVLVGVSLHLK